MWKAKGHLPQPLHMLVTWMGQCLAHTVHHPVVEMNMMVQQTTFKALEFHLAPRLAALTHQCQRLIQWLPPQCQ